MTVLTSIEKGSGIGRKLHGPTSRINRANVGCDAAKCRSPRRIRKANDLAEKM
jgi:hypothetical protein